MKSGISICVKATDRTIVIIMNWHDMERSTTYNKKMLLYETLNETEYEKQLRLV